MDDLDTRVDKLNTPMDNLTTALRATLSHPMDQVYEFLAPGQE